VISDHAPSNYAVLIAELRAGFHTFAVGIDAAVGPSVYLRHSQGP
jgi:hypothetical protein